ncbi:MAG: [Fe-S]-binding protein [Deltaproteobacteria bacterium RBG_13_43_22]|nr:MAG: [Fe-S]-binding protein [Deltaproteobacteria bacterium RBG_13_43_22]
MFRLEMIKASAVNQIKSGIHKILTRKFNDVFPNDIYASILIKPNLNSNMNALTGNTTDLRLCAAVVEFLKERGYRNIMIGEGTNSGFYRNQISVIERLRVDRLAKFYGISVKDLNYSDPVRIEFEDGVKAGVAKECIEADLFINMPKLKTHFEMGMSVCLKNLMGCLVGQENKKKTHQALAANILNINKKIKPHLHIVDAIISMEGLGPTRGKPIHTDTIFLGTDPYLIDLICAKFASFDDKNIGTLVEAHRREIIGHQYYNFVNEFNLESSFHFEPPQPGKIAGFIHSPKRQKYFLAMRNTKFFNFLCSTEIGGQLLFKTGLRQDVFIEDEMEVSGFSVNREKCSNCTKCQDYCPVDMKLPDQLEKVDNHCIECLYCFMVCPDKAIEVKGKLGFVSEQLKQYDSLVRKIT